MADVKITDLPAATTVTPATDVMIIDTGAATQQITVATLLTPEAWTTVSSLGTNWSTLYTVGYMKDPFGMVHLKGLAQAGAEMGTATVYTLPSGYRPETGRTILIRKNFRDSDGLLYPITIADTGAITVGYYGDGDRAYFDEITFKAA